MSPAASVVLARNDANLAPVGCRTSAVPPSTGTAVHVVPSSNDASTSTPVTAGVPGCRSTVNGTGTVAPHAALSPSSSGRNRGTDMGNGPSRSWAERNVHVPLVLVDRFDAVWVCSTSTR